MATFTAICRNATHSGGPQRCMSQLRLTLFVVLRHIALGPLAICRNCVGAPRLYVAIATYSGFATYSVVTLMSHTDSSAYMFSDFPYGMYATSDIPPLSETKEKWKRGRRGGVNIFFATYSVVTRVHTCLLTVMLLALHHLSLTYTHTPPP